MKSKTESNFIFVKDSENDPEIQESGNHSLTYACGISLIDAPFDTIEELFLGCELSPCVQVPDADLKDYAKTFVTKLELLKPDGIGGSINSTENIVKKIYMSPPHIFTESAYMYTNLLSVRDIINSARLSQVVDVIRNIDFNKLVDENGNSTIEEFRKDLLRFMEQFSKDLDKMPFKLEESMRYMIRNMQYGYGYDRAAVIRKFIAVGYAVRICENLQSKLAPSVDFGAILSTLPKDHKLHKMLNRGCIPKELSLKLSNLAMKSADKVVAPHNIDAIEQKLVEFGY
jgi:hypothetical protein